MNAKQRVKRAISHKNADRIPLGYDAVPEVTQRLEKRCENEPHLIIPHKLK